MAGRIRRKRGPNPNIHKAMLLEKLPCGALPNIAFANVHIFPFLEFTPFSGSVWQAT